MTGLGYPRRLDEIEEELALRDHLIAMLLLLAAGASGFALLVLAFYLHGG